MIPVLAFDLATVSGWAADGPNGRPVGGTFLCRSSDDENGEAYYELRRNMKDLIAVHGPKVIIYEAPLPVTTKGYIDVQSTAKSIMKLQGFAAVCELVAYEAGIDCVMATPQEVRAYFCGTRHAGKDGVQARLRQLGWTYIDNNHADAAALWAYEKALIDPKWAPNLPTPLGL